MNATLQNEFRKRLEALDSDFDTFESARKTYDEKEKDVLDYVSQAFREVIEQVGPLKNRYSFKEASRTTAVIDDFQISFQPRNKFNIEDPFTRTEAPHIRISVTGIKTISERSKAQSPIRSHGYYGSASDCPDAYLAPFVKEDVGEPRVEEFMEHFGVASIKVSSDLSHCDGHGGDFGNTDFD